MQLTLLVPESNPDGHMTDPILFTFMASAAQDTARAPGYHMGNSDMSCREILGSWPHKLPDSDGKSNNRRKMAPTCGDARVSRESALLGQCYSHLLLHDPGAHTIETVSLGERTGDRGKASCKTCHGQTSTIYV